MRVHSIASVRQARYPLATLWFLFACAVSALLPSFIQIQGKQGTGALPVILCLFGALITVGLIISALFF
jgi:hypothetical protein